LSVRTYATASFQRSGRLPSQGVHHEPQAQDRRRGEDHGERRAGGVELRADELHDAAEAPDRHRERLERGEAGGDARDAGDETEGDDADERRGLRPDAGEEPLAGRVHAGRRPGVSRTARNPARASRRTP
jgi:hypothetical protein